jgi:fructose-specific component phosphotransferase system IIB-like protein
MAHAENHCPRRSTPEYQGKKFFGNVSIALNYPEQTVTSTKTKISNTTVATSHVANTPLL